LRIIEAGLVEGLVGMVSWIQFGLEDFTQLAVSGVRFLAVGA
jgi:hypothetical protein